jgi:hypothetical protein
MITESVQSIYEQYKYDTDVVASWLAATAKAFGYSKPLGPAPVEKKPAPRLKGKARKLAKEASADTAVAVGATKSAPKYTLAIKDFVPLAAHIANFKEATIDIPDYFTSTLERIIWVRSSFSKNLAAAGKSLNEASDARHSFFMTVLERVRDSFKPLLGADAFDFTAFKNVIPKDRIKTKDRARATPLRNLLEILDVYEP